MSQQSSLFDVDRPEKTIDELIEISVQRVNDAIDEFKPVAVFGLMSGGNDSLPATYVASRAKMFTGAVHINTGIGIEETRNFVRRTCEERGWPLLEYKATENVNADGTPNPKIYRDFCLRFGFPGPNGHQFMYHHLKDRQLERLERDCGTFTKYEFPKEIVRGWKKHFGKGYMTKLRKHLTEMGAIEDHFTGRRVLYVSGVRSQESVRRMGTVEPLRVDGRRIWVAAIHDWSKLNCAALRLRVGLKQNKVCELIGMSGECLCGAFAKPGELQRLANHPITLPAFNEIMQLQEEVKAAGFPWGWGEKPPTWWNKPIADSQQINLLPDMELCHNCEKSRSLTHAQIKNEDR